MPVPPPLPDPANIEQRLAAVAGMLEQALAGVQQAIDDIQSKEDGRGGGTGRPSTQDALADGPLSKQEQE